MYIEIGRGFASDFNIMILQDYSITLAAIGTTKLLSRAEGRKTMADHRQKWIVWGRETQSGFQEIPGLVAGSDGSRLA